MNKSEIALQASNLSKYYVQGDKKLHILDGVSLTVKAGETLAIVGASGAGKSTLLHLLGGLDNPNSGHVELAGNDLSAANETRRGELRNRHLGFIYQFHHLLPEFTALENVAMPLLIGGAEPSAAKKQATALLAEVGLAERLQHKPGELSGGERQRAAVARALVTSPACILADEPTGNLDEATAARVFDLLISLNHEHKTALVLVTHDLKLAAKADRHLELTRGKLAQLD